MAQLDPLLGALVEKDAQELVMAEGRPAALRFDGKLRPVSQRTLDRTQISKLLAELSDRIDAATLAGGTPARFSYRLATGQHFECRVGEQQGQLMARVCRTAATVAERPSKPIEAAPRLEPEPTAPATPAALGADAVRESPPPAPAPIPVAASEPIIAPRRAVPPPEPGPVQAIPAPELGPAPIEPVMAPQVEEEPLGADPMDPEFNGPRVDLADEAAVAAAVQRAPLPKQAHPSLGRVRGSSAEIDRLLRLMVEKGASDLHLSSEECPMLRLHGEMVRIEDSTPVGAETMVRLLDPIIPDHNLREFEETCDTDFAYEIEGVARFRANIFADRKGRGAVFRMIPTEILTAEDLGLPEAVLGLCQLSKGLVLVTGPTGSGKSTTLATMIDHINRSRAEHIITIEDPVEFVHENRMCLVNQREVHTHTKGFKRALRAALREDPDIVLVGEMRDLETIAIAIETAETGHLVFGTLHTTTAISTVDRIIDQFPADRQAQIRTMLSESLKGVVAQTLLKKNGGGRVAALEVLIVTPAISNLIREGKTFQIPSLMQTGKKQGMRLLNDALIELVKNKTVSPDEAHRKAVDKASFVNLLRSAGIQLNGGSES